MVDFSGSQQPSFKADLTDPALGPRLIPAGGSAGTSLVKTSGTDYAMGWTTVRGVPDGGSAGAFLKKASAANGDYYWATKDALHYQNNTTAQIIANQLVPFTIAIFNQGGITHQGGGKFRLMNSKTYQIVAVVPTNFATATDNATYYIYSNGAAIGTPSVQVGMNSSAANSYSITCTAYVVTPATGTTDIDVRLNGVVGTASPTGYTSCITITEVG